MFTFFPLFLFFDTWPLTGNNGEAGESLRVHDALGLEREGLDVSGCISYAHFLHIRVCGHLE